MQTKRVWLILIVLLGLVVNEYRSQRGQAEALRGEITKLRAQQERLAVEVARPALVVRTQATAVGRPSPAEPPPGAATTPPASSDGDHADRATAEQRWEDEARANLTAVEQSFAAEPVNSAWAAPARLALQDRLTTLSQLSSSSLREVDCRSSICRVEVVHRSADASRQFAQKAFMDLQDQVWNGPVVLSPSQPGADGSLAVVMYLGREGTSLVKRE